MGKRWKKRFRNICCWQKTSSDSDVEDECTANTAKACTDEPNVEVRDIKVKVDPNQQHATMAEINVLKQQMDEMYESLSKSVTDLSTEMMEQRKWLDERINVYVMRELERSKPQFPGWFKYPLSQGDSDGFSPGIPSSSMAEFTDSRYFHSNGSSQSRDLSSNVSPPDSVGSFTITNGSKSTTSDTSLPSSGSSLTSLMKSRSTVSDASKQSTRSPYRSSSSFSFSVPRSITVKGPTSDNLGDEMVQIWKMYQTRNSRGAPDGIENNSGYLSPSKVAQLALEYRNGLQQSITPNLPKQIAKPTGSKQEVTKEQVSISGHTTNEIIKTLLVTKSEETVQEVLKEPRVTMPAKVIEAVARVPLISKSVQILPKVTNEPLVAWTECQILGRHDVQDVTGLKKMVNGPKITVTFTLQDLMEWYSESWPFLEVHAQFLCICLLRSLKDLHSRDIIHGCISPGKVVFTPAGYPRLIQSEASPMFDKKAVADTNLLELDMSLMDYISPEHILTGNITEATDIFQVGTLVYSILCNKSPFKGATDIQTKANLLDEAFSLDFTDIQVTKDGRYFIRKLLRTAPGSRFKLKHCKKSLPNSVKWLSMFEEDDLAEETFPSPFRDLLLYKPGSGLKKTSQEPD